MNNSRTFDRPSHWWVAPRLPSRDVSATRRATSAVNDALAHRFGLRVTRVRPDPPAPAPIPVRRPAGPADRLLHRPVFLLSSVRSGSTLLRLILNGHSQLFAPHETHFRRLEITFTTDPVAQAMTALDLNRYDLEHLLWDRVLHRELTRSGKPTLVEKTPSNVFVADRLAVAWPDARFVFLLRHPQSIARSWHEAVPERRSMERSVAHTLWYMKALEKARRRHRGLIVRYEELTATPEPEVRRICDFLEVPYEDGMVDYGVPAPAELAPGIGDWHDKIRSGAVQKGRRLPPADEVADEFAPVCRAWGY